MQTDLVNTLFQKYYSEYADYIKRYCYYKLGDYPDDADDCVQDTFRVLLEKLTADTDFQFVKAFLIKTASNFVKQKLRELDRRRNKSVSVDAQTADIPYIQSYFVVDDETIWRMKDEILAVLSPKECELLEKTCKNYKDSYRTTRQLAAEYGISETAVRQRIFAMRTKIRQLVKEKTKNL